jgi:serine/threonine protein kinase
MAQFTGANVAAKEFSGPAWIWVSARQWSDPAYLPLGPGDPREAGRFRIVARLGEGQAGTVYLASDGSAAGQAGPGGGAMESGRAFDGVSAFGEGGYPGIGGGGEDGDPGAAGAGWTAVKVFDRQLIADPDVRRRLPVGALAASMVRHPHLTSVIDSQTTGARGQHWVASTLVRGPSLANAVTETGPLPAETPGWIALGVAEALATLHETGLAHHAVSPPNVLLGEHGPVLADFGTSRTALIAGPGTAADDVLMLGVTAFFAATGRSPWAGLQAPLVPGIRVTAHVPPGESDLTCCPPWLAPIAAACLAADPASRPTAERLHAWLLSEVGHQPRSWLPRPVAARVTECQVLPPPRGRLRWPRG